MFLNNKISVGIVAHVDAGKTTITEQFLYKAGINKEVGRVDRQNTTADFLSVEKERGITVRATTVAFPWKDKVVQLLDTPGHVDFIAEVERSLSVLDAAVLAISAKEGVQTQTRVIFNALRRLNIPTILFINKVDRMGVDLDAVYDDIYKYLSPCAVRLQTVGNVSNRDAYLMDFNQDEVLLSLADEVLAESSDAYLERVITSSETLTVADRWMEIKKQFKAGQCFPLLHGAALHGLGIDALLDTLAEFVSFTPAQALTGRCYKVDRDDKGNRRCFVRLTGGELVLRESYPVDSEMESIKIRQMALLNGITPVKVDRATAGDIVILYDNALKIEEFIGTSEGGNGKVSQEHIAIPTLIANVKYEHLGQRKEILNALEVLTDEDPFLAYRIHPLTEAIEVKLFGVVQKEIVLDLLKERFGILTEIEEPQTLYKERPSKEAYAIMQMYRHTHLPATVGLSVTPLPIGSGFVYESNVSLGDLKKTFQTAVQDGVKKAIEQGVGQWSLTDLKVTFVDSDYDSVNSTPADYRRLAPLVVEKAFEDMALVLLEPLLSYELEIPSYAIGRSVSDLLRMSGTVSDPEIKGETMILRGIVPVDTCKNYLGELADYTEGKGIFNTKFYGYREVKMEA